MKKFEGKKTYMILNGIFHIAFMLILSFFIFSSQGYGSTDIPVKVITTPVTLGASALFTGFSAAGITNQAIFTVANVDMGTTASSTLVNGFHITETTSNIGTVKDTTQTAPPCEDICILSM